MRVRCLILVLVLSAVSAKLVLAADNSKREFAEAIQQAVKRMDIFTLPAFDLEANVRITTNGQAEDGSYRLLWNGPQHWREEIEIPGYSEVRVGGTGVIFVKQSSDSRPLRVYQLQSLLDFAPEFTRITSFFQANPEPDKKMKKVHDTKVHGVKVKCAELEDGGLKPWEVCIDLAEGTLIRQGFFVDNDFAPVSGKVFPRLLAYTEEKAPLVEVHVTDLKPLEGLSVSTFDPPAGVTSHPGCFNPHLALLIRKVQPSYPEADRQSHVQGTVYLATVIDKNGVPRDMHVISGVSPGLNEASLHALQQWRYRPATCDGDPVDTDTLLTVNYYLH